MAFVKCLNLLGNVGDFFGECSLGNCEMDDFLLLTITLIIVECSNSCLYKLIIVAYLGCHGRFGGLRRSAGWAASGKVGTGMVCHDPKISPDSDLRFLGSDDARGHSNPGSCISIE